MAIVYSYIRFSSGKQAFGSSFERQKELADAWLAKHPEHVLDTTLRMHDLGKSAFKGVNLDPKTGDLGKFVALVTKPNSPIPKGSILLLERLDRFSRDDAMFVVNVLSGLILGGITVITLDPERVADRKTGGRMEVLLPMVMDVIIANEYSAKLSSNVGKGWAKKRKRAEAGEVKLTAQCCAWLRLVGDDPRGSRKFEVIPERVKVLKTIYRLSEQGLGSNQIEKRLNQQQVPTWGKAQLWNKEYIGKLLRTRRVLGEHRHIDEKGNEVGEPIIGYYPAVIPVPQFERVQKAISDRKYQRGPRGALVTNLFTRLIVDAQDSSPMHITAKTRGNSLLANSNAMRGKPGLIYIGFRYAAFENAFLNYLSEVQSSDIAPEGLDHHQEEDELSETEARVAMLDKQIKAIQKEIREGGEVTSLSEVLRQLDADKQQATRNADVLRQKKHQSPAAKLLGDGKTIIGMLRTAKGDELLTLRTRLRSAIKSLVSVIWLRVFDADIDGIRWRIAVAEVHWTSGKVRYLFIPYRKNDNRKEKDKESFALTVTPKLAGKLDIRKDTTERLAKLVAGLLKLRELVAKEKKPLLEVLREGISKIN